MSYTDYSLEPLSSLSLASNLFDFDQENFREQPIYVSLNTVPSFSTPPRSFGTDITALSNNNNGQFLLDSSSIFCRNDFDSVSPSSLNGQTPTQPNCHQLYPTLTSCMIGSNSSHNWGHLSLQSILDSPTSSRSFDSNFTFPESNLFDDDGSVFQLVINEDTSNVFYDHEEPKQNFTLLNNDVKVRTENETEKNIEKPIKIENDDFPISTNASNSTSDHNLPMLTQSGNDNGTKALIKSDLHHHISAKAKKIFPYRLHDLASDENFEPLSWNADGTMLVVNMQTINRHLMKICRTKKFASFLRQLHLYGFRKDARCMPNKRVAIKVAYYFHTNFLREYPEQLHKINRVKLIE